MENLEALIKRKEEIVEENVELRDHYYWGKDDEKETQEEYQEKIRNWDNTIRKNNQDIEALRRVGKILEEEISPEISKSESNIGAFNKLFPFRIYKNQINKFGGGVFPVNELVGAFATKEHAEDFVDYQATIDRETQYSVKKVEQNVQKKQKAGKTPQYQSPKM